MIGDKLSDVEAGLAASCSPMLLTTGYGPDQLPGRQASVPCYENLLHAAKAIVDSPGYINQLQASVYFLLQCIP